MPAYTVFHPLPQDRYDVVFTEHGCVCLGVCDGRVLRDYAKRGYPVRDPHGYLWMPKSAPSAGPTRKPHPK